MKDQIRVLVSAGSKHGSTAEIAERIGAVLESHGLSASVVNPGQVLDVDEFDAVILGSAVYAGHWVHEAKEVASMIATRDPRPMTWLFSSGPVGDPPKPEEEPVDVSEIAAATEAVDHRVFSGNIDKAKLNFGERALVVAVHAAVGDFRDWDDIEAWAAKIADSVAAGAVARRDG